MMNHWYAGNSNQWPVNIRPSLDFTQRPFIGNGVFFSFFKAGNSNQWPVIGPTFESPQ